MTIKLNTLFHWLELMDIGHWDAYTTNRAWTSRCNWRARQGMTLKVRQIVLYLKEMQLGAWSVTDANSFVKTEMKAK